MRKILILGATSMIAQSVARVYAGQGHAFFLVGRNADKLKALKDDLKTRAGVQVECLAIDLNRTDQHSYVLEAATQFLGGFDTVLIAQGELGDQGADQKDYSRTLLILQTNFLSVVSLLTQIANLFESKKSGTIAVIASVAGERGRQSNYIYGTAKGALSVFLQGLRNRLFLAQVQVTTFQLGFVDTPMTRDFKKGFLWASPETVARGMVRAIEKRKDIVYLPGFWFWIMLMIRSIPERVFKRTKL